MLQFLSEAVEILSNLSNHLYPSTIDEAMELLKDPSAVILAGGTGLSLERNDKVETLIDLQHLNLSYITEDQDSFNIGAMTSAYEVFKHDKLPESLRFAAYHVGDTPVLHGVTVGGNLSKFYLWVDLPSMLWALNASVVLYDPKKKKMTADEFFDYSKERNVYARRGLITEIQVPILPLQSYGQFQSFMYTQNEKAQLNLASYFEWNKDGIIKTAKLIVSAATNFPIRISRVEDLLVNSKMIEFDLEDIESMDLEDVEIITNYKSSIEYRRHILSVYLKRTIKNCINEMEVFS